VSDLRAGLFAPVLRGLERWLSAPVYCRLLYPVALVRAVIHGWLKGLPSGAWPTGLPGGHPPRAHRLYRLPIYLNRTFEYLPDRLAGPKWSGYCRFIDLDPVKRLVDAGRPVVLVYAHFGPFTLLRNWLRSVGVPVAMFAGGQARNRAAMKRRQDRWALIPEVALTFYQDELGDAIRHLERGRPLAITVDSNSGRQIRVPASEGWSCRLATGPVRLARRHRAVLVPCAIYNEAPWHVAIEFAAPVSESSLEAGDEPAGAEVMAGLMPILLAHPEEWTPQLAARFAPDAAVKGRTMKLHG
jgi:lauroyl/myristoyl acyltransferase